VHLRQLAADGETLIDLTAPDSAPAGTWADFTFDADIDPTARHAVLAAGVWHGVGQLWVTDLTIRPLGNGEPA
jgi:hypothetical protein